MAKILYKKKVYECRKDCVDEFGEYNWYFKIYICFSKVGITWQIDTSDMTVNDKTREEVQKYRNEVGNSPKYKPVLDDIQRQKRGFQAAKDNPQEYLKAIFNAKMNGDIK